MSGFGTFVFCFDAAAWTAYLNKPYLRALSAGSVLPWPRPIEAPLGTACWTTVLLGALWFVSLPTGRGKRHKTA